MRDGAVNLRHLLQVQLAGQHDDVGELGVEAQGLGVRDVELGAEVHLLSDAAGVGHDGHVGGDDGGDARLVGGVDDGAHQRDVLVVDDGVDGEVALHAVFATGAGYLLQVVYAERAGRAGAHVQVLDAEVDGVCPGLYGCGEGFARADGGHDFEVSQVHACCLVSCSTSLIKDAARGRSISTNCASQ